VIGERKGEPTIKAGSTAPRESTLPHAECATGAWRTRRTAEERRVEHSEPPGPLLSHHVLIRVVPRP
jgi:hypothetical protein